MTRAASLLLLAVLGLGSVTPVHAYAPQGVAEIAARLSGALPLAARWDPNWDASAMAEVERCLRAEDETPERSASHHRYWAGDGALLAVPSDHEYAAGIDFVVGMAPDRLTQAATDLSSAFATRDIPALVTHLAEIATCLSDLADPFQTTPPGRREMPGVRARFSDLVGPADLVELVAHERTAAVDLRSAALDLAVGSASERGAIEEAFADGDRDRWRAIRRERLESALSLGQAIVRSAWMASGSPRLDLPGMRRTVARARPNPSRGWTMLSFVMPAAGPARLDLFDLSGRRVGTKDLGILLVGPHEVPVGQGLLEGLPKGHYFARISAPGALLTGRFLHLPPD